jgi:hypothetical protein
MLQGSARIHYFGAAAHHGFRVDAITFACVAPRMIFGILVCSQVTCPLATNPRLPPAVLFPALPLPIHAEPAAA